MWRRPLIVLFIGLVLTVDCARPQAAVGAEDWYVVLRLDREVLSDDFTILVDDDDIYLPLVELPALLLVEVSPEESGAYSGTVYSTGTSFLFDPGAGTLEIDGELSPFARSELRTFEGALYVHNSVMERLLPIRTEFNRQLLELRLVAEGPLPIEVRRRREQLRERRLAARTGPEAEKLEVPYALLSPPTADFSISTGHASGRGTSYDYNALLGGEVAYLTSQLFLAGNERDPVRDLRMKFGRQSPGGGAFGIERLTEAWAGDIRTPALPLIGGSRLGRGLIISAMPLDRPDSFDATNIEGDAPPEWEVELYQNNLLIDFQQVGEDGRFLFEDVPLLYGVNRFRLAMYGPQGQEREEHRTVRVGGQMTPPGETLFRGFVGQPGQRVMTPQGFRTEGLPELGFSAEVEHGVSRDLSLRGFVTNAPISTEIDSPLALSTGFAAHATWNDIALNTTVVVQEDGGYALEAGAFGNLLGTTVSGQFALFDDFHSPAASLGLRPLRSRAQLRGQRPFSSDFLGRMMVGLRGEYRSFADGADEILAGLNVRHRIDRAFIDHGIDLRWSEPLSGSGRPHLVYSPTFSLGRGPWSARGALRLDLMSKNIFEHASAGVRYRLDERSSVGGTVGYFPFSDRLSLSASYSRDFSFGILSGRVGYRSDGDFSVGLGLTFSMGAHRDGKPFMTRHRLAEAGAIAPHVFHDLEGDRHFDPLRDVPVEGAEFRVANRKRSGISTDESGTALLAGLSTVRPTVVDVDEASLEDPFWISASGPVQLQPRPGRIFHVDMPILDAGEVAGTVAAGSDPTDRPLGGVLVELVAADGRQMAEVRSQMDGFYLFDRVPPGNFEVRVAEGQEIGGVALKAAPRPVTLEPGGHILDGIDILLDLPTADADGVT